jgi:alkanesulfonate monooxygenase SsuD/methylene tetrahydromethanopterin reductase-like flavin-dependent oxidoreductase (luciferase family)
MKHIGLLSFGHWIPSSQTRSAYDVLLQSIDLAVAAEELGADGAYFRGRHFTRQLGSPHGTKCRLAILRDGRATTTMKKRHHHEEEQERP